MMDEIVCIIDKSGSMKSIRNDAIDGINAFLDEQKKVGEARLTLVFFDHEYQMVHDRVLLSSIGKLTEISYVPRGTTALYDAIGRTIDDVGKKISDMRIEDQPNKVVFAILTDGQENASKDYKRDKVNQMIEHEKKLGHKIIFLSADQDAFETGRMLGVNKVDIHSFVATGVGVRYAYHTASDSAVKYRTKS